MRMSDHRPTMERSSRELLTCEDPMLLLVNTAIAVLGACERSALGSRPALLAPSHRLTELIGKMNVEL